jgi:hypothetical protein
MLKPAVDEKGEPVLDDRGDPILEPLLKQAGGSPLSRR